MRGLSAKPFLASKMAEHDVILTSFVANLSETLEQFSNTMCTRNVREITESVATIGAAVLEILQRLKNSPPPTRARVKYQRQSPAVSESEAV